MKNKREITRFKAFNNFLASSAIINDHLFLVSESKVFRVNLVDKTSAIITPKINDKYNYACVVVNGKLLVICRRKRSNVEYLIMQFDPKNDTWTHLISNLEQLEEFGSAVTLNGYVYYFGEMVHKYNPKTNIWTKVCLKSNLAFLIINLRILF